MREIKFRIWTGRRMLYDSGLATKGNKVLIQEKGKQNLSIPMQFTGLKDKNGKEIYEGDVVKVVEIVYKGRLEVKFLEMVVFEDGAFWLETTNKKCPDYCKQKFISDDNRELEVIGNIYENPEFAKTINKEEEEKE